MAMAKRAKSPTDRSDRRLPDLVWRDGKSQPYRHIRRDADTGKFVSVEETQRHPKTTTVETTKKKAK